MPVNIRSGHYLTPSRRGIVLNPKLRTRQWCSARWLPHQGRWRFKMCAERSQFWIDRNPTGKRWEKTGARSSHFAETGEDCPQYV